jgi:hypothetical protein
LDGVVGKVEIAQDSERDRHASVTGQASQRIEGLSVPSLRLVHQLCVHPIPPHVVRATPSLGAIGLESPGAAYRFNLGQDEFGTLPPEAQSPQITASEQ